MTLIAISTHDNSVEVVTDTLEYSYNGRHVYDMGAPKVQTLPSIDAAITSGGGATILVDEWGPLAQIRAREADGFDEFTDGVGALLRVLWSEVNDGPEPLGRPVVYHVGWSDAASRFVTYAYAQVMDFEPVDVTGVQVFPGPCGRQFSTVDRATTRDALIARGATPAEADRLLDEAGRGPEVEAPASADEWRQLAVDVRFTRGVAPRTGILVGGQLIRTALTVGDVEVDHLGWFDDTGDEFAQLLTGSMHPLTQVAPCPCGSGERYLDCHLELVAAEPCDCSSGLPVGRCCSIANPEPDLCDRECCTVWLPAVLGHEDALEVVSQETNDEAA